VQKKQRFYSGIRICRIARIQPIRFLIRAIRKIRIQKAFSCLVPARPGWELDILKAAINFGFVAKIKVRM
jgi:hypothetical protein